jgi:SH3-like domain-containing protein
LSALLAGALVLLAPLAAATQPRETPSGQPVPRYAATRFATVNARSGPGDDYKLVWTYRARGLPLQIVAETFDWRRVCDPDGGLAWVHRRTVDGDRRVMNTAAEPLVLLSRPRADAAPAARLAPRATAALLDCKAGWCRIKAARVTAFAPQDRLWGTSDAPQCARPGVR